MLSKKDKYLSAAQKLADRGQLEKALLELGRVVQDDPKDTRTWLKIAELHARRGANQEAAEIYQRTGDLYTEQGFLQKAVAVYKNVLKLSPSSVGIHQRLGSLFKQLELLSDAAQQLELAAVGFQQAGRFPEAVSALREAVELQPDSVVLRVNLAEGAAQAGLTDEAVRELGHAADMLKASGRIDEYVRVAERLLFLAPNDVARALELSAVHVAHGSARLALPKLQLCLAPDPLAPEPLSLLARALEMLGQTAKAVSVLKELARACDAAGRASERDAAIARYLALDPGARDPRSFPPAGGREDASMVTGSTGSAPGGDPCSAPDALGAEAMGLELGVGEERPAPAEGGDPATGLVSVEEWRADASARVQSGVLASDWPPAPSSAAIARILAESEVFIKYELFGRAAVNLERVLAIDPAHRDAREMLVAVLTNLERNHDAAQESLILAQQLAASSPELAEAWVRKARMLDPESIHVRDVEALVEAQRLGPSSSARSPARGDDGDPNLDLLTPPLTGWAPSLEPQAESPAGAAPAAEASAEDGLGDPAAQATSGEPPAGSLDLDVEHDVDSAEIVFDLDSERHRDAVMFDGGEEDRRTPLPEAAVAAARWSPDGAGRPAAAEARRTLEMDEATPILHHAPMDSTSDEEDHASVFGRAESASGGVFARFAEGDVHTAIDREHAVRTDSISRAETPDEEDVSVSVAVSGLGFDAGEGGTVAGAPPAEGAELEAELEMVSFFIDQGMFDDVDAILGDLELRFPGHPRLVEMQEELVGARHLVVAASGPGEDDVETVVIRTDDPSDPGERFMRLGQYDAAIDEYKRLARDPAREVFALTRMGDCHQAKGACTEAILRYKRALNCDDVTRDEARLLYFQLGSSFERLGDISEALYFFEKVAKRDPDFHDVARKIAELIPRKVKRA